MKIKMTHSYTFIVTVNKPNAFAHYVSENISWATENIVIDEISNNVTLHSLTELNSLEIDEATQKIDLYVDPPVFMIFKHAINTPMITEFTTDAQLEIAGKKVLQTFIFTDPATEGLLLDSLKTVIEYNCPNTQDFNSVSNASIDFEIYDITRDISILTRNISLDEIETKWKGMNLSADNDTVFRTSFFGALHYQLPNYDCIWQIRVGVSHPEFKVRLNSLQQLFYEAE